jgi:phage replication-related protein YjqB (UPF0714/DUF867 family)
MADRYRNFVDLAAHEKEDLDFRIRSNERHGQAVVIAPHGGGIEPGTSELADAIAGADLSFYAFEGMKAKGNRVLHITSSHFDERLKPLALVAASPAVVALHGELDCPDQVVFLGGLDKELGKRIRSALEAAGFAVRIHDDPNLQGVDKNNICNRGSSGRGVQLESPDDFDCSPLTALGISVQHIHTDGHLESHDAASLRLAQQLHLPDTHMFSSQADLIADAYRLQEERIAYDRSRAEPTIVRDGAA